MIAKTWTHLALYLTWLGILVAYWPTACTPNGTASESKSPAGQSPAALVENGPSSPSLGDFLPHPAFALAKDGDSAKVTIADIAARTTPSVVNIATKKTVNAVPENPFFRHFFGPGGPPRERERNGLGSGVVVSTDGLILTNNHVIEGADEITVTSADGKDFDATLVGADEKSDVAVLRVEGDSQGLVPIAFGDSSKLRVGDVVLAIGNPFGVGQTVTMGIVSAKGRSDTRIVDYADFIQTDAAINPGNSGGALVNMQGELVGINTAILSRSGGYQGIGFAIPSNMAESISQSLLTHGRVVRGWLGIGIQDVDSDLASALGLDGTAGVLVSHVEEKSPAEQSGIRRGDVILKIAGEPTKTASKLRNLVAALGANKKVPVEIARNGKKMSLDVLLGEREGESKPKPKSGSKKNGELGGLSLEDLSSELRRRLDLPSSVKGGAVISRVEPGSPGDASGLRPGDVILEVNRQSVKNVADVRKAYRAKPKGDALLLIYRGGTDRGTFYVALKR